MKAHVFQHVAFEGIGSIAGWLEARTAEVTTTRFHEQDPLPQPGDLDLLIVMGGPMSVNDEEEFPWLRAEKQFVRDTIKRGIPVLGICLGAQLIASALGSKVYRSHVKEIGWFPIDNLAEDPDFAFPQRATVFHWHGETFDLPRNARRIAMSAGCDNQAFQLGRNVIALQFHLETTPESTGLLLQNCSNDLTPGPYVQSPEMITSVAPGQYATINRLMNDVLSYLVSNR